MFDNEDSRYLANTDDGNEVELEEVWQDLLDKVSPLSKECGQMFKVLMIILEDTVQSGWVILNK